MSTHPDSFAIRAGIPLQAQTQLYGLLSDLIGNWVGNGFNVISKPGLDVEKPYVLQVNPTKEVMNFSPIAGSIPDRGTFDPDLTIFGLTYEQQVSDRNTSELLHVERGMWINQSAGAAPPQVVTRMATIPHGDSLLASGVAVSVAGGPDIQPASAIPTITATGKPVGAFGYFPPDPEKFPQVNPFPRDTALDLENCNTILTAAIAGQNITNTIALVVSTNTSTSEPSFGGGILNIPYVTRNANAISMDATFWIETVSPPNGVPFLQLQYTQNVILSFPDGPQGQMINWPHISVGTLVKN